MASTLPSPSPPSSSFDLATIKQITDPLGIPWHPLLKEGHNFQSSFSYIGFEWDIHSRTVTISSEKCLHLISKLTTPLSSPPMYQQENHGFNTWFTPTCDPGLSTRPVTSLSSINIF